MKRVLAPSFHGGAVMKGVKSTLKMPLSRSNQSLVQSYGDVMRSGNGRSSISGITATVFGGYGFMGRYLINELGQIGSRVYVPFRGCELEVRHLKPMFDLGQLGLMPFSPRDEASILETINSSDVVINMIGKHYETKHLVPTRREDGKLCRVNYSFEEVNVTIPTKIAELCKKAGVKHYIHVGALAADVESKSIWNQTKARGEAAVREVFPDAIIVKPATVFGSEDRFLNWIGETMWRVPAFPLIREGSVLVQPVAAEDVGKAIMNIIHNVELLKGTTFQLAGPAEYTYREVVEFVGDLTGVQKPLIDVNEKVATLVGTAVQELINPVLTADHVAQMCEDVVHKEGTDMLSFEDLNIVPSSMDKLAFDFLHRFRPGGHFEMVKGYH